MNLPNLDVATFSFLEAGASAPRTAKGYQNSHQAYQSSTSDLWSIAKAYWHAERAEPAPVSPLPSHSVQLDQEPGAVVYRLGHSTVLIRLDGHYLLTDPVFSERASPVSFAGPKRFQAPAMGLDQLPAIKAVVLSHDHYDHLDKDSVLVLDHKVEWFVAPLGVGQRLIAWGIDANKVVERDWWQQVQLGSLTLTATPAQHFSGRGLFDRDKTLWASWVLQGEEGKIFFSGDSGYFPGFKSIGERLGPFDLTLVETGAYNELWSAIHMLPEQSVQAHVDLKGRVMVPIHNGTFDLALHDWQEPLERARRAADQLGVTLATPHFGEAVRLQGPVPQVAWWRESQSVVAGEWIPAQQDLQF